MKGLIQYKDIANIKIDNLAKTIINSSKLNYGNLTLDALQLGSILSAKSIHEKWEHEVFGYGVYVFFDENIPVYIGKADSNFKHRFQSHKHFDGRENYAFNRLARFVAERKLKNRALALNKKDFTERVIPEMEKLSVVRINLFGSEHNTKKCSRLENLINMCVAKKCPGQLYNPVASVSGFDITKTLNELM